jgi:hypothetical protein
VNILIPFAALAAFVRSKLESLLSMRSSAALLAIECCTFLLTSVDGVVIADEYFPLSSVPAFTDAFADVISWHMDVEDRLKRFCRSSLKMDFLAPTQETVLHVQPIPQNEFDHGQELHVHLALTLPMPNCTSQSVPDDLTYTLLTIDGLGVDVCKSSFIEGLDSCLLDFRCGIHLRRLAPGRHVLAAVDRRAQRYHAELAFLLAGTEQHTTQTASNELPSVGVRPPAFAARSKRAVFCADLHMGPCLEFMHNLGWLLQDNYHFEFLPHCGQNDHYAAVHGVDRRPEVPVQFPITDLVIRRFREYFLKHLQHVEIFFCSIPFSTCFLYFGLNRTIVHQSVWHFGVNIDGKHHLTKHVNAYRGLCLAPNKLAVCTANSFFAIRDYQYFTGA